MSYLYRQLIADALKARLDTIPSVKSFAKLDRPLQASDLPAAIIYTPSARRGQRTSGNHLIQRLVTVKIEAAVQSTPFEAMDAAAELAATIERAIEADASLGNTVDNTEWQQTITDVSSFGEMTLGVVLLEYDVSFYTQRIEDDEDGVIPTSITVNSTVTPAGYVRPLHPARMDDPAIIPADISESAIVPATPAESAQSACDGESCDVPAWGGDQP